MTERLVSHFLQRLLYCNYTICIYYTVLYYYTIIRISFVRNFFVFEIFVKQYFRSFPPCSIYRYMKLLLVKSICIKNFRLLCTRRKFFNSENFMNYSIHKINKQAWMLSLALNNTCTLTKGLKYNIPIGLQCTCVWFILCCGSWAYQVAWYSVDCVHHENIIHTLPYKGTSPWNLLVVVLGTTLVNVNACTCVGVGICVCVCVVAWVITISYAS